MYSFTCPFTSFPSYFFFTGTRNQNGDSDCIEHATHHAAWPNHAVQVKINSVVPDWHNHHKSFNVLKLQSHFIQLTITLKSFIIFLYFNSQIKLLRYSCLHSHFPIYMQQGGGAKLCKALIGYYFLHLKYTFQFFIALHILDAWIVLTF